MVIRLEQNGDYVINSEKVAAQENEKFQKLLEESIKKMPKIKVITADGVTKDQLLEVFDKLSKHGVTDVTVVTQGENPPKLD